MKHKELPQLSGPFGSGLEHELSDAELAVCLNSAKNGANRGHTDASDSGNIDVIRGFEWLSAVTLAELHSEMRALRV
jgi:hypothetical protein